MMKHGTIVGAVFGMAFAAGLTGCMSMDVDGSWHDVEETRAVDFATDPVNPLEKRLEAIPKIANQQQLARIVVARGVAPEVKAEARKRIDEAPALAAIALNAPVREDQVDALRQIMKSEAARIEAAWIFAAHKSSSNTTKTLLKGLSDDGRAKFAASFIERIDAADAASEEAGRLRRTYGEAAASGKVKEIKAILNSLVKLAPCVEDEKAIEEMLKREDIAGVKGTEYDFLTPLEGAYQRVVAERREREARGKAERKAD